MNQVFVWLYAHAFKPVMFLFSPDNAHSAMVRVFYGLGKVPGLARVARMLTTRRHPELVTDWKGLHFSAPIGLSAGLDKNGEMVTMIEGLGFGFMEVGSVTAYPCEGNERPWFYRLVNTGSMVVHVGLANHGVERILRRLADLSPRVQHDFPKILSIARTNRAESSSVEEGIADYVKSVKAAAGSPAIQAVELNISCPNAFCGEAFTKPELLEQLLSAVDEVGYDKPIFIKLPVDLSWEQTAQLLDVAVSHRITGVTASNLLKDRSQAELKDELPDTVKGNLSGAPLKQPTTELIGKIYRDYGDKLTIIGVGGIFTAEDAYEKIKAGATFVEIITAFIMRGPILEELSSGLVRLLKADGYTHISQAVGANHRK